MLNRHDFNGEAMDIFELFKNEPFAFFLDSSQPDRVNGRFSFIGFDPFEVFYDKGRNSIPALEKLYNRYAFKSKNSPPFLYSGIVGYFGYDLGFHLENIPSRSCDDVFLPDCFFGFYDSIISIDHYAKKLYISSTGLPEKLQHFARLKAEYRIKNIIKKLNRYNSPRKETFFYQSIPNVKISSNFTKPEYISAVKKALDYIERGDIYQVNLSQRFVFDENKNNTNIDPLFLYKTLRQLSPSSFSAYFDCGGFKIASSSPERFLRLKDNVLQTRPMKGTRPRGNTFKKDNRLERELLKSKKDKAELLMITDLERNDLGKVCKYGSVKVSRMRELEKYETVFQTTSSIEGLLQKDKTAFDAITACFPGGSITGCPKIRSMEIIDELEPTRRALYTGSLGYISFSGQMDFNILIRTMIAKQRKIYFNVGGGIVSDSSPEKEYQETLTKAKAMRMCLANIFSSSNRTLVNL